MTLAINDYPPVRLNNQRSLMLLLLLMRTRVRLKNLQIKQPTPDQAKSEEQTEAHNATTHLTNRVNVLGVRAHGSPHNESENF
jgi:hypothetical protein